MPLLAGGSRVQSLWVQPVPRECVQGVSVAVEGFLQGQGLGLRPRSLPTKNSRGGFGPIQEEGDRPVRRRQVAIWKESLVQGGGPRGFFCLFHPVLQLTQPRANLGLVLGGGRWLMGVSNDGKGLRRGVAWGGQSPGRAGTRRASGTP